MSLLRHVFKNKQVNLRSFDVTYWGKDEFSLGSYSAFHVGSSPKDCMNLRSAVENQLWFVGEHCYDENIGTLHGAFDTGLKAADEVIRTLK